MENTIEEIEYNNSNESNKTVTKEEYEEHSKGGFDIDAHQKSFILLRNKVFRDFEENVAEYNKIMKSVGYNEDFDEGERIQFGFEKIDEGIEFINNINSIDNFFKF